MQCQCQRSYLVFLVNCDVLRLAVRASDGGSGGEDALGFSDGKWLADGKISIEDTAGTRDSIAPLCGVKLLMLACQQDLDSNFTS